MQNNMQKNMQEYLCRKIAEKFAIFNADPISKTNIVSDVETDFIGSLSSSGHHFRRQKKLAF